MKRMSWKGIVTLIGVMALAACTGTATPTITIPHTEAPTQLPTTSPTMAPEPIVQTDALGRELVFDNPAQRVVSIAPSNTEILFAVGAGDLLVGRDEFSDYPEAAVEVPSIGSTYGDLNVEAIVGLDPDLILAAGITPPEQIQAMEDVGLPVFVLGNPSGFEGLFENLETVGILTGHEAEAQALVEDLRTRLDNITSILEGVEPIRLFYEIDGSDPSAPWTTGSNTFQQLIFELAGGDNIASDIEGWGQISLEELIVRDPVVILFGTGPFVPTTVEILSSRSGWGDITAVKEGQIFGVNTDLLDLPGPRLIEGLEAVVKILHPDLLNQ